MSKSLIGLAVIGGCVVLIGVSSALAAGPLGERLLPKTQLDEAVQRAVMTARAQRHPKTLAAPRPTPPETPARSAGVVEMRQGPFPATEFTVRNVWQGPVGSDWLLVYAGAKRSPGGRDQPAVRIYSDAPDLHMTLIGTFPANNRSGALKIARVSRNLIELQTDGGDRAVFNLLTRQYQ